ncbi:MAG: 30S ribosomal protein S3 [Planctomycetota bacterium]
MGQKVHPYGFRVGITQPWKSMWIADKKTFGKYLVEDQKLKAHLRKKLPGVGLSKIDIERSGNELRIVLHVAQPGRVIGRGGEAVEELRKEIASMTTTVPNVTLNIKEVANPLLDGQVISESIAEQIVRRASFRRTMKSAMERTYDAGALGVKIKLSGRLGGAEIARDEVTQVGSLPMHTLFADIRYGYSRACTTYGVIGVKVWVYVKSLLPEAIGVNQ